MDKNIGVIMALVAWAQNKVKGWGNMEGEGSYRAPTLKTQFVKPKKKKPRK